MAIGREGVWHPALRWCGLRENRAEVLGALRTPSLGRKWHILSANGSLDEETPHVDLVRTPWWAWS